MSIPQDEGLFPLADRNNRLQLIVLKLCFLNDKVIALQNVLVHPNHVHLNTHADAKCSLDFTSLLSLEGRSMRGSHSGNLPLMHIGEQALLLLKCKSNGKG